MSGWLGVRGFPWHSRFVGCVRGFCRGFPISGGWHSEVWALLVGGGPAARHVLSAHFKSELRRVLGGGPVCLWGVVWPV